MCSNLIICNFSQRSAKISYHRKSQLLARLPSLAWKTRENNVCFAGLRVVNWTVSEFFFFHIQIRLHFKTQHRQNNSIARHQQTLFFTFPIFTCSCSGASSRGHVTHTPLWAAYENLSGESPAPVTDTRGRGRGAVYLSFQGISNSNFSSKQGGGGNSIVFHSSCQYDIVTGKNLGSLVQISKGCDSYLVERGRGKAKELANIAIYRLFDRMCVSFDVAIICLCKPFWYFLPVIV